ncbi:MAG: hypothetical protein AB4368_32715 [Xenococcaceae cyanobacterium]
MISNQGDQDNDRDLAIQRAILSGRKFSLAEAIGREGGGFMKGDSPVPKLAQAIAELQMITRYSEIPKLAYARYFKESASNHLSGNRYFATYWMSIL